LLRGSFATKAKLREGTEHEGIDEGTGRGRVVKTLVAREADRENMDERTKVNRTTGMNDTAG